MAKQLLVNHYKDSIRDYMQGVYSYTLADTDKITWQSYGVYTVDTPKGQYLIDIRR